ncbi:MAG: hypothetical protein RR914_00400 [Oscillospiraceae bacterium]
MIKGINKQVLEIHDIGCEYFEKAIFFVKPEYCSLSEHSLREKAGLSIKDPMKVPKTRKQKAKTITLSILKLFAAAGAGAAITALIQ